MSAAACITW